MSYSVYILELGDGRLYVGSTDDLARRLKEHKEGRGGWTTRIGKFGRLLYSESYSSRRSAERCER